MFPHDGWFETFLICTEQNLFFTESETMTWKNYM